MSSFPVVPIVEYDVNPQAMVEAGHVVATLRFALERPDASLTELVAQLLEERVGALALLDTIERAAGLTHIDATKTVGAEQPRSLPVAAGG